MRPFGVALMIYGAVCLIGKFTRPASPSGRHRFVKKYNYINVLWKYWGP